MADINFCVLGAGVIGLNTALELQKEFRNASVTIMADKFYKDTTSFVAAGLFLPSVSFRCPTEDMTRKWCSDSYYHWCDIAKTYGGSEVGVLEVSGYMFSRVGPTMVQNHYVEKLLPMFRSVTEEELNYCANGYKYGSYFSTLVIENNIFLPWATKKFQAGNGKIITRKIDQLSELAGKYDVVINCTGLGAKFLCHDNKVVPLRGQILKVNAPLIDKFYLDDWDTYVIPGFEGVTLGGTRQYESYNLNWNKYDEMDIKERCEAMLPSLRDCPVVARRVGLRPYRTEVRIEPEVINVYQSKIKIVHNYGHSGYGVTVAPGSAKHSVKLVREFLMNNSKL